MEVLTGAKVAVGMITADGHMESVSQKTLALPHPPTAKWMESVLVVARTAATDLKTTKARARRHAMTRAIYLLGGTLWTRPKRTFPSTLRRASQT